MGFLVMVLDRPRMEVVVRLARQVVGFYHLMLAREPELQPVVLLESFKPARRIIS